MFEKEIEQKLQKDRKEKARQAKRKKRKVPSYKGYAFRNWLVYPIGVLSVELELAQARKYDALVWSDERAVEIINKYLVKVCNYEEESRELSFSMEWYRPWEWYAKGEDKLWCKKYSHELSQYLKHSYNCEGFKKSLDGYNKEWIVFTRI